MIHKLENELGSFGSRLHRRRPLRCPELELWLLGDDVDLEVACDALADGVAPRLDPPSFAQIEATTFPDVDSPHKSVALHWLQQLDAQRTTAE